MCGMDQVTVLCCCREGLRTKTKKSRQTYRLVPVKLLFGQVVLLRILDQVCLQLGEDRLELLEGSLLRHLDFFATGFSKTTVATCDWNREGSKEGTIGRGGG